VKRTLVWIAWAACVVIGVPAAAFAQGEPRASLAAGYVFLFQRTAGDLGTPTYPAGWIGTGALRLGSSRWSAVGEFGISYDPSVPDEQRQLMGTFGGARVAVWSNKRMTLFAQFLAGFERFSEPGLTESSAAVQPGGGFDIHLSSRLFLRVQGDYRWSQPHDATFHTFRVVGGIGIRIN